jgi:chromosome segregation ATPase
LKRIYAEPDEQLMEEISKYVDDKSINRHQLILKALDSFLHQSGSEPDSLRIELDSLKKELDSLRSNRDSLMSDMEGKRSEIDSLKIELDSLRDALDSQTIKMNQMTIKVDSLNGELKQAEIAHDSLKKDLSHANDIIKLKDQDIGFLQASYHELIQRLTPQLPPSQEEAKKKGWWQFWK